MGFEIVSEDNSMAGDQEYIMVVGCSNEMLGRCDIEPDTVV
jgi:hypothetical protein